MSGQADEEDEFCDSRTASFGQPRSRNGGVPSAHGQSDTSGDNLESKRRPNEDNEGSVSGNSPIDTGEGSGRGSSSNTSQNSDAEKDENSQVGGANSSRQSHKGAFPAVQWNRGSRSAIRTTLTGSGNANRGPTPNQSQNETASEISRSSRSSISISDHGSQDPTQNETHNPGDIAVEKSGGNDNTQDQSPRAMSISEGSESGEITEGDDDIVLNLSGRDEGAIVNDGHPEGNTMPEKVQHSPTRLQDGQINGHQAHINDSDESHQTNAEPDQELRAPDSAKEDAIRSQALKYRAQPTVLADLFLDDLETQAKYIFYNMDIRDIDLSTPIKCINCRKEGHLAEVCPDKECEHCGAWARHESCYCPSWRRCQRCRERGHDRETCSSPLIGTAMEVPCDRCGSNNHLENDCDMMWKTPWSRPVAGPITVSISCGNCTSRQHLIGDCPNLRHPMASSSWTLKCYDPSMINEPSFLSGSGFKTGPRDGNMGGMRIRGRADVRSPSPESDLRTGGRYPLRRNQPQRSHIRFDPGIGRSTGWSDRNNAPQNETRDDYRDRDEFIPNNTRQRSLSPDPRPVNRRGRGDKNGDRRPPLPREPPPSRGRGGQLKRGGKFAMANRNKSNKPSSGGSSGGDAYRPLPGAAKKAWDKHRL